MRFLTSSLFGISGTGVIYISPTFYESTFDANADIDANYRIWTGQPGGVGTSSQSSTALEMMALQSRSDAKTIIGIRQDADFRASVGVVNLDYAPQSFRITASSPAGSRTMEVTVPGYSVSQVPVPAADLGYMTIVVKPVGGATANWTAF